MPWSEAQMRALGAIRSGWKPKPGEPFAGVSKKKATRMMQEGIKPTTADAAKALRKG